MKKSIYIFTVILMIAINSITAQVVQFQNPSFEGTPQPHVLPTGWSICMPGVTPDTQPGSWGINLTPSDGNSYVGLVYQPSTGWQEGAGQTLNTPMNAGLTYHFFVDLAVPASFTAGAGIILPPYCAQLQVWGGMSNGNSACDQAQLLWTSPTISNTIWLSYGVSFVPTSNWDHILFLISTPIPACTDGQYLLMDNLSNFSSTVITNHDESICANPAALTANPGYDTYHWSTGANTQSTTVTSSGTYYVTATVNSIPSTDSVNVTLTQPYLNLDLGNDTTICGSAYLVLNAGNGFANYSWNTGASSSYITINHSDLYTVHTSDTGNCVYNDSIKIIINPSHSLNLGHDTAFCNYGPFTLDAGIAFDTYHWSTGATTQTISISSSGTYYVTATNIQCAATALDTITCTFNPLPIAYAGPNDTICNGSTTIMHATGGTHYGWYPTTNLSCSNCANPTASPTITTTYNVTVTDALGCSATDNVTINVANVIPLTTNATCGLPNGMATVVASGGSGNYSYVWGTTPLQYGQVASNLSAGNYSVSVTDNVLNCTIIKIATVTNIPGPTLSTSNISVANCGMNNGSITISATGGTAPITYAWNTTPPQTTLTLSNVPAGNYCITATDANNCVATHCATIITGTFPAPDICMVSFDTASDRNIVIWEKPLTAGIAAYNIYRESNIAGTYNLIGSQTYASFSTFIDTVANPLQQPYRYRLSLNDNCSFTSQLSNYHQSIHLVVADMGSVINLLWNDYEGFTFYTYNIYRGSSYSNLTLINSVSSNVTSYTDLIPPSGVNYYMVEAVRPTVCNPSKSSTSPISNIPSIYMTGINEYAGGEHIQIYPNPNTGLFTVSILNPAFTSAEIEILNSLGQVVFNTKQNEATLSIDISNYASGVYIIKVNTEHGNAIQKFIKE